MEDEIPLDQRRLDAEWSAVNALRETLGIANRGAGDATCLQALALGRELAPRLFDPEVSILASGQEPPLVREYRQRAEAQAALQQAVTPLELIDNDILEYERLLDAPGGARPQLHRALQDRIRAREWFEHRAYTEHKLIERDVYTAKRADLPCPSVGDKYVEYRLPFERALRIRLLHPDRPEHTTGADLVYEFCDQANRQVRLAFVQYKIWDGNTLRFSDARNLELQLQKLAKIVCEVGLCTCAEELDPPRSYRLPCCAAFLRPTDRLQRPDANLISSGLHVPICVANTVSLEATGGRVLKRDPLRNRAVSQRLFEELFNRGMLGSSWIPYSDVEALYREHRILDYDQRIIVYAQEFQPAVRSAGNRL